MERVNIVVLASLAAALATLSLRLLSDATAPEFPEVAAAIAPAFGAGGLRDRKLPPRRIALSGDRARDARQPPSVPTPGAEKRRASRGGTVSGGQSGDLIAGLDRRDLASGGRRSFDPSDLPAGDPDDLLAGRVAAVPRGGAGSDPSVVRPDSNNPHTLEFVDDDPTDARGGDVLLRIPFDGGIDAEVGGGVFEAEGLVTSGDEVQFPENAQFSFPAGGNVNSEAGTISFEIRPQWAGSDETDNSFVQIRNEHIWENALSIVKNRGALRFIIIDSGGVERNVNIPIGDWAAGEVQRVSATWDEGGMALYVNGELVGQARLPNPLQFSDTTPVHIGSDFPGSSYVGAGGWIRDFTIYGRALGAEQIARL